MNAIRRKSGTNVSEKLAFYMSLQCISNGGCRMNIPFLPYSSSLELKTDQIVPVITRSWELYCKEWIAVVI